MAGYEADDTLATLAEKYKNKFKIIIVSGDKDFAQLVDDDISLYDPSKDKDIRVDDVVERFGVSPSQFIDYLAICGDNADNIPGVKGIGKKGAEKLLNEFGSLKNIYENISNIKSKNIVNKLETSQEDAFLSQKLATIVTEVPLKISDNYEFNFSKNNFQNAFFFLKEYELDSVIKKLNLYDPRSSELEFDFYPKNGKPEQKFETIVVDSEEKFAELLQYLQTKKIVALDTETTSINPFRADLVGISICADNEKAYYIPIAHQMAKNLNKDTVLTELSKILESQEIVGHNLKYDYIVLERAGWKIRNNFFDTIISHYLLHPSERHSLENCAKNEFGYEMMPISQLIGKGKKQITFDLVDVKTASFYAAEDAWCTFILYEKFKDQLIQNELWNLYNNIELPLLKVIAKMEKNGVNIDENILIEISHKNQRKLGKLTHKIYEIAGYQFNLNSTQQLGKLFFEEMGITPIKKTKTGFSTDVSVLEILAKEHKIAEYLIEYRQISKLESTYVKALPKLINPISNRINSSFNQTVASTGRLSSSNPNLQNIPIRTAAGREIRKAFSAKDDDYLIIAADYSQIELRLLAILSKDEKMIKTFRENGDIHSQTASVIFDLPIEQISSEQRRYSKIINFGLIYGMGSFRISKELDITRSEAKEFIENYFANFPTIKNYIAESIEKAKVNGFAETIFGRRLFLPHLSGSNKMKIKESERVAVNMPIQGSAADIIKIAMITIHRKIKNNDKIKMISQVHDELVFEVHKSVLDDAKALITTEMESVLGQDLTDLVKLKVDVGVGANWFEAH